jgi:predicted nucleic acid-binding protein
MDRELSYYDASYIELALRLDLKLLSFDRRLASAMGDGNTD